MSADLLGALANYVGVLAHGLEKTARSEERTAYTKHLAAAAIMFSLIQQADVPQALRDEVAKERRAIGYGYLTGSAGEAAEVAFHQFTALVDDE